MTELPDEPTMEGCIFTGWYTEQTVSDSASTIESELLAAIDESYIPTEDATFYAGWKETDGELKTQGDDLIVDSGSCGTNAQWKITGAEGNYTLSITGSGGIETKGSYSSPWYSYRYDIQKVVISDQITSLGMCAFEGMHLAAISLPVGIKIIGISCFYDCDNDGNEISFGNDDIFSLPDSVTTIGDRALWFDFTCRGISIPKSVTHIGIEATNARFVYYEGSEEDWNKITFDDDYIKENCTVVFSEGMEDSGKCGENLTWAISSLNGNAYDKVMTISGKGKMTDYTSQYSKTIGDVKYENGTWKKKTDSSKFEALVSAVKDVENGGAYPNISIFGQTPNSKGKYVNSGHSLLGYKVEESNSETKVYVYDCNFPNSNNRYITFTKKGDEYTGWSYYLNNSYWWGNDKQNGYISYIPYNNYQYMWSNRGNIANNEYNIARVAASDYVVADADGETIGTVTDGVYYGDGSIYENIPVEDSPEDDILPILYMPDEEYSITNQTDTQTEISALDNNSITEIKTDVNTVILDLRDSEDSDGVVSIKSNKDSDVFSVTVCDAIESSLSTVFEGTTGGVDQCFGVSDDFITLGTGVETADITVTQNGEPYYGWAVDSSGRRYMMSNGDFVRSQWFKVDGKWYLFDDNGYVSDGPISEITGLSLDRNQITMNMDTSLSEILRATIYPADAPVRDVIWTSTNESVVEVTGSDDNGLGINATIKAKAAGVATITATSKDNGIIDTCTVTVKNDGYTGAPTARFQREV